MSLNATAPSSPGHNFWGYVTIDGNAAPDGIAISAEIEGVQYASATTQSGYYDLTVQSDDIATSEKDGGVIGDTVVLYVNGIVASEQSFASGGSNQINLSITSNSASASNSGEVNAVKKSSKSLSVTPTQKPTHDDTNESVLPPPAPINVYTPTPTIAKTPSNDKEENISPMQSGNKSETKEQNNTKKSLYSPLTPLLCIGILLLVYTIKKRLGE